MALGAGVWKWLGYPEVACIYFYWEKFEHHVLAWRVHPALNTWYWQRSVGTESKLPKFTDSFYLCTARHGAPGLKGVSPPWHSLRVPSCDSVYTGPLALLVSFLLILH